MGTKGDPSSFEVTSTSIALILYNSKNSFGNLFTAETKHIKQNVPRRIAKISVHDQQTTTAVAGWAKPSG